MQLFMSNEKFGCMRLGDDVTSWLFRDQKRYLMFYFY
jgi:hypothetical protein